VAVTVARAVLIGTAFLAAGCVGVSDTSKVRHLVNEDASVAAFEVELNGERLCTAGAEHQSVMSVMTTLTEKRCLEAKTDCGTEGQLKQELTLNVNGLVRDADGAYVFLEWIDRRLQVGDEIRIKVLQTSNADEPKSRRPEDPRVLNREER
jgi:hypothetical protein